MKLADRAIGYLRLSPRAAEDERLGLDAQRELIRGWAAGAQVTVMASFEDVDVTGDTDPAARPQLQAALAALDTFEARVLVVAKRDRLARDVSVANAITKAVLARGAVVRSADGVGGDGSTAADELVATVVDATSQYELKIIKERTRAALAAKRRRGEVIGKPRYGFRAVEATGGRVNKDGRPLMLEVPDQYEQFVLETARKLQARGSLRDIARALNAMGLRNRAGTPFSHVQVSRMLKNSTTEDTP